MHKIITLLFFCFTLFDVRAQDSVTSRVVLIGDAGKIDQQQQAVLSAAAGTIISGKTTILYLGDNVYPSGIALPGSPDSAKTREILNAQFSPMRAKGAPVYFIPGNHDWDAMGKNGLAKIQAQSGYLESLHDPLLKMVPANGCPDPVEIDVSPGLTIIAFDSEWWLFTHNKTDPDAACSCTTPKDVTDKLGELLYKNRSKVILLASHHPFQSYGHHGGYFSLKDHLFPLTSVNSNLYIPLPVIGSLYPLLRSVFLNPEDLAHPLYKSMVKQVSATFDGFPNLIRVAGHEHGLQFIDGPQPQVVSGAGAKNAFVKKGRRALFTATAGGFVTADLLINNTTRFTYYVVKESKASIAFSFDKQFTDLTAQTDSSGKVLENADSANVTAHPLYDSVTRFHKKLFGENYRSEWAAPTRLPVIRISQIKGGLTPTQRGGGHQSKSLRLIDAHDKEWVLRSVNKYPEVLLPEALRETFAKDIVTDAMSAQHPYSALVVPDIAEAAGVPHAHPIIGVVAPDKRLGIYEKDFAGTICLLEEREPTGNSVNAAKMYKALDKDNDNQFDSVVFLRARLLDLFLGDWDRHEDQWRWAVTDNGKFKRYTAVPRDRDQVFHRMQGLVPWFASLPWIAPLLHDFDGKIKQVNGFFTESNALNKRFLSGFDHNQWMNITNDFVNRMNDTVLENALSRLPAASYRLGHDKLIAQLKARRSNMPAAMDRYYRFVNRTVDLQTSDKNEFVSLEDAPQDGLHVRIFKVNKDGKIKDQLFDRTFYPDITKEIRLYVNKGDDSVIVDTRSKIRLRIIGKKGDKSYSVLHTPRKVNIYGKPDRVDVHGPTSNFRTHLSDDSINVHYVPANPYNKVVPSLVAGFNLDDGLLLGAAVKFINQGFRKVPYGSMQVVSFQHSSSTSAFKIRAHTEWLEALGKADIVADGKILAPDNTQNFFGVGNETSFDKSGNYKQFYRTRFAVLQFDPGLRWRFGKSTALSVGLSAQYYSFDERDNIGRFINNTGLIHSYDSATIGNDKVFGGATARFTIDRRNNKLLPSSGAFLDVKLVSYAGLNDRSRSFTQVTPEFSVYKALDRQGAIVVADRIGGGVTFGNQAFYQSVFLGGQENLLGYRQYRFAGQNAFYNNFEARIRVAQIGSYIIPGQLGVIAFYDLGKVWADRYNSNTIHQGTGGGLYFAPAQMAVVQFVAGYSREGWYPYLTIGLRF